MAFNPLDIRRATRAHKLRDMDPDQASKELEKILIETIVAQQSGIKLFQANTIKELRQLRSDMQLGHVNAGSKQSKMIGAYSHVIDQLDEIENRQSKQNKEFGDALKGFGKALPSMDTFVSALMTANPLVGYGVKIMRDIAGSRKEARRAREQERKERERLAQAELDHINKLLNNDEKQEEILEEQRKTQGDLGVPGAASKFEETHEPVLMEMRDTLHNIEGALVGDLERVDTTNELLREQIEAEKESSLEQIQAMEDLEKDRNRNERLTRLKDNDQNSGIPKLDALDTRATNEKKGHGGLLAMLSGLMRGGLLGGLLGAAGALLTGGLLKPIFGVLKFLTFFGKNALTLGTRLFAPAALVMGIFNIIDGFMNAEKILGMSDVNIAERIFAGFANLGNVLIDLFDGIVNMVANEFGIDIPIKEFMTVTLPDMIFNSILWMTEQFEAGFEYLTETLPNQIMGFIESIPQWITDMRDSTVMYALDMVEEGKQKIKGIFSDIVDALTGFISGIFDSIHGVIRETKANLAKLPGMSYFFDVDPEDVVEGDVPRYQIDKENLNESIKSSGLVDSDTMNMTPWTAPINGTTESIRRAERESMKAEQQPMFLNAPTTNQNVQNHTNVYNGDNNTGNQNHRFRSMTSPRPSF